MSIDDVLSGKSQFAVVCGDATAVMATLPDGCAHVCYTDPPYGLSAQSTKNIVECLTTWLAGGVYTHKAKGFMSADWDSFTPGPEAWREVHRCLRPGGYCVAFSSTRTVDLLGIAVRLAGFDVRPGWAWVQGGGFPKSLNVSIACDRDAGEVRDVVGVRESFRPNTQPMRDPSGFQDRSSGNVTVPSSPAAVQWDGYGTDVKPAFEPLIVARKALDGTVAHNVQAHGCGALNIDGARIGATGGTRKGTFPNGDSNGVYGDGLNGACEIVSTGKGRFPAALALVHDEGCVCEGTRRVRGDARTGGGERPGGFGNVGAGRGNGAPCAPGHADPDGMETVDAWTCTATCAVAELGRQSGDTSSQSGGTAGWQDKYVGGKYTPIARTGYDDTGNAARFFYQASWDMRETPQRCYRCGLLSQAKDGTVDRCNNAKNAESDLSVSNGDSSVLRSAPACSLPVSEGTVQKGSSSAKPVETPALFSQATPVSSAPENAATLASELSDPSASDVAHRADSCGIGTAPSHAPRGPSSTLPQPLGHLFTDAHNSPIPSSNRVPAVNPASTGTTPTTPNPMKWCGCAPLVTSDTTTPERPEGTVSDPTSRFRYVAKASSRDRLAYITCTDGCVHHESVAFQKDARDSARDPSREHPHGFCRACNGIRTHYQHPTVKPLDLAKYHARLLSLPPHTRPIALVPFCGTGIEARALLDVGFRVIAIDLDPRHCAMTEFRLTHKEPDHVTEERAAVTEAERGDWTKPIRVSEVVVKAPVPSARKEQIPLFGSK